MIRNLLNVPTWATEGKKEKKGWDRREKEFSVQQDFLPRVCAYGKLFHLYLGVLLAATLRAS